MLERYLNNVCASFITYNLEKNLFKFKAQPYFYNFVRIVQQSLILLCGQFFACGLQKGKDEHSSASSPTLWRLAQAINSK